MPLVLRFHQGVCLLEANKLAEARLARYGSGRCAGKPIAVEAALCSWQARITEGQKQLKRPENSLECQN